MRAVEIRIFLSALGNLSIQPHVGGITFRVVKTR
jgi:hypothetical protein